MIEIGHRPILWHIMKIYTAHGLTDFIICCGYKGHIIKEYFANYFLSNADVTFDIKNNKMEVHHHSPEPWRVTLVDTGENSMTGGRIKRVGKYLGNESFCLTYGDGVTDLDIKELVELPSRAEDIGDSDSGAAARTLRRICPAPESKADYQLPREAGRRWSLYQRRFLCARTAGVRLH